MNSGSLLDIVGQLSLLCIMSAGGPPPRAVDEAILLVEVRGDVVTVDGLRVPGVDDLGAVLVTKRAPLVVLAFDQDVPARTMKRVVQVALADGFSTIEFLS